MTIIKIFLAAFLLIPAGFKNAAGITDSERKYATDVLTSTSQTLLSKVKALTPAQLAFKADTSSWSVAECLEHIAITENSLFGYSQSALKVPADPSKRSDVKLSDENVLKMITDRSSKFKAQAEVTPTGKFGNTQATLKEFTTSREKHISYIKTTTDDLRNHYNDFPFGKVDAYQTILFMAGHCKRHTAQIDEIMANPNFPKAGK